MNIRFANDAIREYKQGPLYFPNTGEAFEVKDAMVADELLHAKAFVAGEMVNVFALASDKGRVTSDESSDGDVLATYPEDFPGAATFARLGLKHEEVLLLDRDQLIALDGIGPRTADAVLAANPQAETTEEN